METSSAENIFPIISKFLGEMLSEEKGNHVGTVCVVVPSFEEGNPKQK